VPTFPQDALCGRAGVSRRKFVHTTVKGSGRQAPDLIDRNFTAESSSALGAGPVNRWRVRGWPNFAASFIARRM
jgi:hypothetical protein